MRTGCGMPVETRKFCGREGCAAGTVTKSFKGSLPEALASSTVPGGSGGGVDSDEPELALARREEALATIMACPLKPVPRGRKRTSACCRGATLLVSASSGGAALGAAEAAWGATQADAAGPEARIARSSRNRPKLSTRTPSTACQLREERRNRAGRCSGGGAGIHDVARSPAVPRSATLATAARASASSAAKQLAISSAFACSTALSMLRKAFGWLEKISNMPTTSLPAL